MTGKQSAQRRLSIGSLFDFKASCPTALWAHLKMKHLKLSVLSLLRTDNRINGICLSRKDPIIIYVQSKCRHIALSPSRSGRGDFEHNQTANRLAWRSSCLVLSAVVVAVAAAAAAAAAVVVVVVVVVLLLLLLLLLLADPQKVWVAPLTHWPK